MSSTADPERALRALQDLQSKHELAIIKLSEPISVAFHDAKSAAAEPATPSENPDGNVVASHRHQHQHQQRASDASNAVLDLPTPASLEADLAHYRELFAKLRFSYVEQVTKEKFIRAIVGDPPLLVTARDNADLEAANGAAKARLKALKTEVADMVTDLEVRGRELATRHARIRRETARLGELPGKIAELEQGIRRLREEQHQGGPDDQAAGNDSATRLEMQMPLAKTALLLDGKRAKIAELDRQLEQLSSQVPRKRKELERLQVDLGPLEAKRQSSSAAAKEARRRKEAALGGVQDDLEERARWWRASETTLKQMLDIKG